MFNRKKRLFLGLLSMSLVLVFTSACQKAEVYNIETNVGDQSFQEDILTDEVEPVEEDIVDEVEPVEEKELEVKILEVNIVFEDLEWKKYNNKLLAYTLEYPTIVNVMGDDLDQRVEFVGPLSNNEWWPRISIAHYSNDFYRPGEDDKLSDWVKPFPEYKIGEEVSIAGLETLHYTQAKSPQAWAADYYYFIKDAQLYNISIIHSNDKQDWKLYNKILDSFSFGEEEEKIIEE